MPLVHSLMEATVTRSSAVLSTVWLAAACVLIQSCGMRSQECTDAKALAAVLESRLRDWPSLSRYRDSNAKLPPAGRGEERVVFLGDSITDLWDDPGYGGFFPGKPYINRGISSQTTPQMLVRFRRDVLLLQPRVVVILAGTNDIAGVTGPTTLDAIEDNLASMAELAHVHGIRVVLASLLPTNDSAKDKDGKPIIHSKNRPPDQIKAFNERIKAYAMRNGHIYVDYYSAMVDEQGTLRRDLTNDGIHANEKGYAIMTPLVEQAIAEAVKGAA
jgi:lysophospholipase L1-like esterase